MYKMQQIQNDIIAVQNSITPLEAQIEFAQAGVNAGPSSVVGGIHIDNTISGQQIDLTYDQLNVLIPWIVSMITVV